MDGLLLQPLHSCLQSGFTLVGVLIATAIVGILSAAGIPAFTDSLERNRLVGATEAIYGLLLQARSDGILRDADMSFHIQSATTPWCAGYSATAGCDCTLSGDCVVNVAGTGVVRTLQGSDFPGVAIAVNFTGGTTTFDRIRGTASHAGTIAVGAGSWQLNIVISNYGRIRLCNPRHPDRLIAGYKAC